MAGTVHVCVPRVSQVAFQCRLLFRQIGLFSSGSSIIEKQTYCSSFLLIIFIKKILAVN